MNFLHRIIVEIKQCYYPIVQLGEMMTQKLSGFLKILFSVKKEVTTKKNFIVLF